MKIWLDITNSPQANFFRPFIRDWQAAGHRVVITCRDLADTVALIEQNRWRYTLIGGHAGRRTARKLLHFPARVARLAAFLAGRRPDIGISHSSFYAPPAARLLGIPSIYLNDNEHAEGNRLAFRFASVSFLPDCLRETGRALGWSRRCRVEYYPGVKEGVYLSQLALPPKTGKQAGARKTVHVRTEPDTAQYYRGGRFCLDRLLGELKDDFRVVLHPRNRAQAGHYRGRAFAGIHVCEHAMKLEEIYRDCDLFIGAGGSMTREMAWLGVPTVSVYQDRLLAADRFLVAGGHMRHIVNPGRAEIARLINSPPRVASEALAAMGRAAYRMISAAVDEYAKN